VEASIVVATFNRSRSLANLLGSFHQIKTFETAAVEILVVDNGSSDDTWQRLSREREHFNCSFTPLRELRHGKASALNRGLRQAKGRLVVIVDDDVVVGPEWLASHLDCHRNAGFDAVQGRVLPGVDEGGKSADPTRLREYNIPVVDYGEEICDIRGLTGTNMSLKREVWEKVGFFDPRLGPGASGFSEDTEYSIRIRKAGFKIGYAPAAVVYHELNSERYGARYNRRVQYRKGISRSIYRHDSICFKVLPDLLVNCLRLVIYRIIGSRPKAYKTEGRVLKGWGYLVGKLRAARKRNEVAGDP
jgi:GT2 family glycosyltransferase